MNEGCYLTFKDEYIQQIEEYLLQKETCTYLILIPSIWHSSFKQIGQGLKTNDFKTWITVHGHLLAA